MRKLIALFSFLFLCGAVFGQLSQFRMIGSGSWTTVNDSTFSSTVTIQSDLTSNGFLPTGITDTMKVFSQTGQRYQISSATNLTFSGADLIVVESGGDWGAPVGQILIYENQGREAVPSIPFSATGATAKMQEAAISYNSTLAGDVIDGDKGEIIVSGGNWLLNNNIVDQGNIVNNAVTNSKIATDAIDQSKILDGEVTPSEIQNTTVTPGSYTNINATIDEDGRITAASSGNSGGGQGLTVLDTTFTSNYVASTDSVINILTSVTESNDIVVSLPEPSKSTVAVTYTVNQVDRNNDDLGFTLVQVDGVGYDFYNNGDTLQFVSFTPDVSESYKIETIYLDGAYRWNTTKISSENVFFSGIVAPVDTNKLWLDGSEDGIPKLWNPITQQYDPVKFDYEVDNVDSIYSVKFPLGSIIRTKGFSIPGDGGAAVYLVQEDSVRLYNGLGVIELSTGNYAIMQPTQKGGYKPEWFGARVNDNLPDSVFFERMINFIKVADVNNVIQLSAGVYDDPLIRAYSKNGSGYDLFTVKIIGVQNPYTFNQNIVSSSVLKLNDTRLPGIIFQHNRGSEVRNVYFQGVSTAPFTNKDSVINMSDFSAYHADGDFNPYAGIVIDPFVSTRTSAQQYPGLSGNYTSTSGGSSLMNIEKVGFYKLESCVTVAGSRNGDNVNMRDMSVENCRRLFTSYSTQARQNSIDNAYVRYVQTVFKNTTDGAPPAMRNMSGAGFIREIFNARAVESKITMDNCQWESLWRIGQINGMPSSITQTQFKFDTDTSIPSAPILFSSSRVAEFVGCSFLYFANCTMRPVFPMLTSSAPKFTSCHFQGGLPIRASISSQTYGEIIMDGSDLSCTSPNTIVSDYFGRFNSLVLGDFVIWGDFKVTTEEGTYYHSIVESESSIPFNFDFIGSFNLVSEGQEGEGYIIVPDSTQRLKLYDGLISTNLVAEDLSGQSVNASLGYVYEIASDTIRLRKIAKGAPYGSSVGVYCVSSIEPVFFTWGNTVAGNDTIKDIFSIANSAWIGLGGVRLDMKSTFKSGSYVKEVNVAGKFIVVSSPAILTTSNRLIKTVDYSQKIYTTSTSLPTGVSMIKGCNIINSDPLNDSWNRAVCTVGGRVNNGTNPSSIVIESFVLNSNTEVSGSVPVWNAVNNRYEPGVNTPSQQNVTGITNPKAGTNTIQASIDSLALTYSLFPAITYTPTDSIPIDTTLQSFPITGRLNGDTLRQITYTVTKAPTVNLNLRVLIWDGSSYTAAFSGTIPAGQRSVAISGSTAVATDERIFVEILTDSGASGLDLELKFQKP